MVSSIRSAGAVTVTFGLILFFFLTGCAHVVPVKKDPEVMPQDYSLFKRQPEKFPHRFAVVIDEPTRKFTITQYGTVFPVGEELFEQSSYTFSDIFRNYQVFPDRKSVLSGTDRILVLHFGPGSSFLFGPTMFHEHTAEIHLVGEVYDLKDKRLWKGEVKVSRKGDTREASAQQMSGTSQAGIFSFMTPARNPQDVALGNLVYIALTMAVEEMKYDLATKGRKAIGGN